MDSSNMSQDLNLVPAGAPPPGVVPDFSENAPSQRPGIIGVCVTLIVLVTLFVAMRCWITAKITKKGAAECVLSIIASVFAFIYMAFLIHLSYVARHMWDVPAAWLFGDEEYWKLRMAGNISSYLAFFFSRMPVFALYLRIFGHMKAVRIACWAGIVLAFFIYMHALPVTAVFCVPRDGDSWISINTFMRCSQAKIDAIVFGVGNIVMDLYVIILPIPLVAKLQMSTRRKLGVLAVFLTGAIALVASCVSLKYRLSLDTDPDTDWNEGAYDITSAVEVNIVIICSCMPALSALSNRTDGKRSLFASLRSKLGRGSASGNSSKQPIWSGAETRKSRWGPSEAHGKSESAATLPNHSYIELSKVESSRKASSAASAV